MAIIREDFARYLVALHPLSRSNRQSWVVKQGLISFSCIDAGLSTVYVKGITTEVLRITTLLTGDVLKMTTQATGDAVVEFPFEEVKRPLFC